MTVDYDHEAPLGEGEPPTLVEQLAAEMSRTVEQVQRPMWAALDKLAVLGQVSERAREIERDRPSIDDTEHGGDVGVGVPLGEWATLVATVGLGAAASYTVNAAATWPTIRAALLTLAGDCINWILDGDARALVAELAPELTWWGEDSERISATGHLDLALFTAAAKVRAAQDCPDGDDVEFGDAMHVWLRPLTVDFAIAHYQLSPARARQVVDEGESYEPCDAADTGAMPFTVIDLVW